VKYLFNPAKLTKLKKLSAIEVVHSDEHVRAWTTFIQSDAEFLICFEDDAVFKMDSSQRVFDLIHQLSESVGSGPIYIDLAGGVLLDDLKIDKLESNHDASFRYYSKPVTNTACVYLMNRSLILLFHSILAQRPWLRLIQVDFMMNKLFMILEELEIEVKCMHAEPTIFKHGSATGEYSSTLEFGRYWH
jgi:GR25 family glycosyltransferase involved in LPS biosynthesis